MEYKIRSYSINGDFVESSYDTRTQDNLKKLHHTHKLCKSIPQKKKNYVNTFSL